MAILERLLFEPPGGMFREFFGVKTYLEPADRSLYRRFLPDPFSMPDQPVVMLFIVDYARVFPWPLTRYREWAVGLKSLWQGEESWYVITMPVTTWLSMQGGRLLGFPKYIADEITLTRDGDNWRGEGRHKGALQLALQFQPGITRPLVQWESELLADEAFFRDAHLLVPPGRGPRVQRVRLVHRVPPTSTPVLGTVSVRVDPSEPWAGLIPAKVTAPGVCSHFTGGVNLVAERPI